MSRSLQLIRYGLLAGALSVAVAQTPSSTPNDPNNPNGTAATQATPANPNGATTNGAATAAGTPSTVGGRHEQPQRIR